MGKLIGFIIMLSVIYMLFAVTGQLSLETSGSLILEALFTPSIILTSAWWKQLITGAGSIAVIAVTTTIIAGIATRNSDLVIFTAMASGLVVLAADFIIIFNHLASFNRVLATMIMSPILLIYVFVIVEWLRGKD